MGLLKYIAKAYLKIDGWEAVGPMPEGLDKGVFIAAPHTSNWDLPVMLSISLVLDADLSWIGKHTLFEGRFGRFFTWLGGIPVDRRSRNNAVEQIAEQIEARDRIFLSIAPEGTRSYTEFWKSGFYYIANTANVPIICGFLDYKTKRGGVGRVVDSQQPIQDVMDQVREFYDGMEGYHTSLFGPIQLREELEEASNEMCSEAAEQVTTVSLSDYKREKRSSLDRAEP